MRKRLLYDDFIYPRSIQYHPNFNDNYQPRYYPQPPGIESFPPPFTQYAKPRQPDQWYQAYQEMPNDSSPFSYANGGDGYSEPGEFPPFADQAPPSTSGNDMLGYQQQGFFDMEENTPEPQAVPKQPNGILSQFQNSDGQMDIDKMLNTVGQMANTYHQVAPIIKQFGSFMKNFR